MWQYSYCVWRFLSLEGGGGSLRIPNVNLSLNFGTHAGLLKYTIYYLRVHEDQMVMDNYLMQQKNHPVEHIGPDNG